MAIAGFNNLGPRTVLAGGFKLRSTAPSFRNASTANQTDFSADTYLAGSSIKFPLGRRPVVGASYHCRFDMVKTAAGTATPIVVVRFGTAGAIADTAVLTFTFTAGSAVADTGMFELWAHWRTVGATGVLTGVCSVNHALAATGLTTGGTGGQFQVAVTSSAFDSTVANSYIGVSFNGGASFVGTNTLVQAEVTHPKV